MSQIRLPYVHIVHCDIEFNDEGIRRGKSRGKADVNSKLNTVIDNEMRRLVQEASDRKTSLDRRLDIRRELTLLRRQLRAERSRLA